LAGQYATCPLRSRAAGQLGSEAQVITHSVSLSEIIKDNMTTPDYIIPNKSH